MPQSSRENGCTFSRHTEPTVASNVREHTQRFDVALEESRDGASCRWKRVCERAEAPAFMERHAPAMRVRTSGAATLEETGKAKATICWLPPCGLGCMVTPDEIEEKETKAWQAAHFRKKHILRAFLVVIIMQVSVQAHKMVGW